MKKICVVLFFFCLLAPQEILAGGVAIRFLILDNQNVRNFAREFIQEMKQREHIIMYEFVGQYSIDGFIGSDYSQGTRQLKSCIRIFVDGKEVRSLNLWLEDLYSEKTTREKARETAEKIFRHLKRLDREKTEILI